MPVGLVLEGVVLPVHASQPGRAVPLHHGRRLHLHRLPRWFVYDHTTVVVVAMEAASLTRSHDHHSNQHENSRTLTDLSLPVMSLFCHIIVSLKDQ